MPFPWPEVLRPAPPQQVLLRSPLSYDEVERGLRAELADPPATPLLGFVPVFMQSPSARGYVRGRMAANHVHLVPSSPRTSQVRLDGDLHRSEYGTDLVATLSVRDRALFGSPASRTAGLLLTSLGVLLAVVALVAGDGTTLLVAGLVTFTIGVAIIGTFPVYVPWAQREMAYLESWIAVRLHATRYVPTPGQGR